MSRKPWIIGTVIVLVGGLGFWFYRQQQYSTVDSISLSEQANLVVVQVAAVKPLVFPDHINTVGTLQPLRQAVISSEIAGRIQKIAFQPGVTVKSGDLLFKLDDLIYQSNLDAAQAALTLSQATYRRLQQLSKGQVSEQDIDQAKAAYEQDQAKVKLNQAYLAETQITAPFTGVVGYYKAELGDQITPGESLVDLIDRSQLQVWYQLPEKYLTRLKVNQAVTVHAMVENKDQSVTGRLIFISPNSDPDTHAVSLRAIIPNYNDQLSPGLFVHVTQTLGVERQALAVPEEAVINTLSGQTVFVIRHHKAVSQAVSVGPVTNGMVPVLRGLSMGDEVVTEGQDQLKEGSSVRIAEQKN